MGRRHELAEGKRLLSAARLLTLTGPGGVGKTRLASRLAEQVARAFPDGVWLVPLAGVQDGSLVPYAVADALGIHDETGREPVQVLIEHLLKRQILLVLDNCEHLPDACASLISRVLAAAEGVRVLATSRHRLGLTEEHLLHVAPLRAPDPEAFATGVDTDRFPALRLFADRAAAVLPGFEINTQNGAAVARLCHRLDGLPLAIELAAVRLRVLSVQQLGERLDDRYRLLTSGSPTAPPRHKTLRSAVDWSHDLCTPQERLAWARLAVFAGSLDLEAAEAVCAGKGLEHAEVLDAVAGLVEKSILLRDDAGGMVRYRMLATLRQYGLERLDDLGEADDVHRRHRDHFLRLAEEHGRKWFGPGQSAGIARLRAEQDNLRAALDFCVATPGEARQGMHLVGSLWFYWAARGAWVEARLWWRRLLARTGWTSAGAPTRAVWLTALMPAIHSRSTAVLLAGPPPEPTIQPHEAPAVKPLSEVLTHGRETVEEQLGFHILNRIEMACTLTFYGLPERAVPLCTEALAFCEAYGEEWARSYVLCTLATAQWALGDYDDAAQAARQCLRLEYVANEPYTVGRTLEVLAVIAAAKGEAERTAVMLGAAEQIWYDIGHNPLSGQQPDGARARMLQTGETLGEADFERAYRRGRELSVEEAIAYALDGRPGLPVPVVHDRPAVPDAAAAVLPEPGLTARESQVADLIAQGLTNRQIAEALVISRRTAEGHVERILAKLGFATRSQVAAWISAQRQESPAKERPERR